jgi:hypothetical protein
VPAGAELTVDTAALSVDDAVAAVLTHVRQIAPRQT